MQPMVLRLGKLARMLRTARIVLGISMVLIAVLSVWLWSTDRPVFAFLALLPLIPLGSAYLLVHRLASSTIVTQMSKVPARMEQARRDAQQRAETPGPRPVDRDDVVDVEWRER